MSGSTNTSNTQLPVVLSSTGPLPLSPTLILQYLTNLVTYGTDPNGNAVITPYPGYTNSLPGSMVADISGTDVAAIYLCDQARIETINSLTPYGANPFLLTQIGNCFGIPQQSSVNTSVNVIFYGTAGYVIPIGFIVSDGTNQYSVQDGGIVATGGATQALYCLALNNSSAFAVAANTVTQIVSSVATGYTLTCNNPIAGTPSPGVETLDLYRQRVLDAETVTVQGTPQYIKTLVGALPGVVYNQVSVKLVSGGYEVIVGGGDPYEIAYAIYQAAGDLNTIVGSTLIVSGATLANPGVITTNKNHLFSTGQVITISGSLVAAWNGTYTITVISETTFSIGVNTTGFAAYTSGGVVTPNLRNNTVQVIDYPDTYAITFVQPPQQIVGVTLSWNTTSTTFVAANVFNQFAQAAIVQYINGLGIGQPINLFVLNSLVAASVSSVLPAYLIDILNWSVTINSVATSPITGTQIIPGDPESYMAATTATVTVNQI